MNIAGGGVRGGGSSRTSPVAGARIISGPRARQRRRRGDPHRPPGPLPGHARRERQPGPLPRRQPAHARGAVVARAPRRDRRGDDRDRAPRPLRAAGAVAVREVGGHLLQLRLPAQRVPPAPPAARAAAGHPRRARDPRPAVRGARCLRRGRRGPAAGRRRGEPGRLRRRLLRRAGRQARARPLRAEPALPHARPHPARRRRRGRGALGRRPPLRAGEPGVGGGGRASRARGSSPGERLFDAILASPSGLVFSVDEPEVGLGPAAHRRRPRPPRHPRAARGARRPGHRAGAGRIGRVPVRALGRRAALVHRQHDLPRPGLAEARRGGVAADQPRRRRGPGRGRRRRRARHDQARQRDGRRRGQRDHAARPRLAAQRARASTTRRRTAPPSSPARRPTSSPPARTATGSPARRGTSTCRPGSSASAWPDAAHPLRRVAVPHRPHHRPDRRLVDAARAARAVRGPVAASTTSRVPSAAAAPCWPSASTG